MPQEGTGKSAPRARPGRYVVVAGPDGTGKSTLAAQLVLRLPGEVLVFHSRPSVLPQRSRSDAPSVQPHGKPPYGRLLSIAKVAYLWLDYAIGWLMRVRPAVQRGTTVIIERGWWDLAVDQERYRLDAPRSMIHVLGMLLPSPHSTLILTGDAEVVRERKPELPHEELHRQLAAWRVLAIPRLRPVFIDVGQPVEAVVTKAIAAVLG